MATTKKGGKKSGSSNSAGKANTKRKTSKKQNAEIESFTNEVLMLIILALAVILMVSNFGVGGFVGDAISSFFFGLFGLTAYIFPVLFDNSLSANMRLQVLKLYQIHSGTSLLNLLK